MAGLEEAVHDVPRSGAAGPRPARRRRDRTAEDDPGRQRGPVIVITARGDDEVVVSTLDSGADDYLIKPFTTSQLAARVRAVLRRSGADAETRADLPSAT